ncbi:MAG: peptidoglycan-binding protein [Burkholderiales bacterium]|nr:peptidoglycan-binding protein [Burkholderiales bacterium]
MSLLEKLGLPSRTVGENTPAPGAKASAPGVKPTVPRAKIVVPPPDEKDGRRTRLDLDDEDGDAPASGTDDASTPTAEEAPATPGDGKPSAADAPAADAGPRTMRVDIVNRSGATLTRLAFATHDSEHVAYDVEPPATIPDKGVASVLARAVGDGGTGPAGNVEYFVGSDARIVASMSWRHGASPVGKVNPNDGRFIVTSLRKGEGRFQYVVESHKGPAPEADPPMRITIDNRSGSTLTLAKSGLDNAKSAFAPEPPATIGGGKKVQFTVASSDPEFPQVSGFADYGFAVDPPPDPQGNPSGQFKMSIGWAEDGIQMGSISPESKGMEIEFSGGDRTPVFTLFAPDLEFKPPGKASEPTLRKGDKSADGWVEYLQELLNIKGAKLEVDGDFGGETLKAVKAFQRKHKKEGVLEDGVVGDETWSFLREGAPAKPKTDGRKPHTFVEKGNEARWTLEARQPIYDEGEDVAVMNAVSVGDIDAIAKRMVRFRIVSPTGKEKVFELPIGEPFETSKTGQGNRHNIPIRDFSELFGPPPVPKKPVAGEYKVTAYFPAELGGDTFDGVLKI